MASKQDSFYQLCAQDQKALMGLCANLFETASDSDVTFITKERFEVKAHKLILSLSSSYFRNLFKDTNNDPCKIILPNYSNQVLTSLLQFFYTGEILIADSLIEEFAELCQEFQCEEIPVISELIETHIKGKDDLTSIGNALESAPKEEVEFDEIEFENTNETIFFNENEEFLEHPEPNFKKQPAQREVKEIKQEYVNVQVQYLNENPEFEIHIDTEKDPQCSESSIGKQGRELSIEFVEHDVEMTMKKGVSEWNTRKRLSSEVTKKIHKKVQVNAAAPSISMNISQLREEQDKFKRRLQEAINSCRDDGNSARKAAKMFSVPADAIERSLKGFRSVNS